MQTRPLQLPGHPVNLAADALALALAVGLPLYFPNGYVGLVGAKFDFLLACLPVAAAAMLIGRITAGRPAPRRRFDPVWLWPVGLCACYALAWWFAEDRYTALWGLSDRKNGLMLYIACTAVYLATAVFSTPGLAPLLSGALTAAGCAATVLSWLNYWMLDPLDA
mgnify:CR=1 FL=1